METVTVKIEDLQIGIMLYTFEMEINYYRTESDGDYYTPETVETEIATFDALYPVTAWNTETERENIVTDQKEIDMILQWVDVDSELMKAIEKL